MRAKNGQNISQQSEDASASLPKLDVWKTSIVLIILILATTLPQLSTQPARTAQTTTSLNPILKITLLVPTSNPPRRAWALLIQDELISIGVDATRVELPFSPDIYNRALSPPPSNLGRTYDQGGFDLLFVGYNMGIDADPYSLYHSSQFAPGGQNYYLWNNSQNDRLTSRIGTTIDETQRLDLVKQWQVLAADEQPSIPILYTREAVPFDSKIMNGQAVFSAYHYPAWPPIEHLVTGSNASIVLAETGQAPGQGVVPELSTSYYDTAISNEIFSSLAVRNDTIFKTMIPELASGTVSSPGWSVAADNKTWTVNLRPGVTWHDGAPFNANDVKFTFDLYQNDTFGSPTESFVKSIVGGMYNVMVTGPFQVQFHLPAPYAHFVQNILTTAILPKHVLQPAFGNDYSKITNSLFNQPGTGTAGTPLPVGTGPYKWVGYNSATTTSHLVRNDNYFNFPEKGKSALLAKGQFTVKDYYVRTIVGTDAAITALNNGEVDILDSQYHFETQPSFLATWGFSRIAVYDGYGVQEIGVNMRHPVLGTGVDTPLGMQDPTKAALAAKYVRQAISHAVPRDQIISDLLQGYGVPAVTTPVVGNYKTKTAGTEGFDTDLQPYSFNLTKSRELLQLAGYPIDNGSSGLKTGDFWSLSAIGHCSLYCPFRSIANVNRISFSVENVATTLVTLDETFTFDNGTQPRTNIIQGDLKSGIGNLSLALITGGLGAGDAIYDSTSASRSTLNPTINATVTKTYAGALREVNVVTLPYAPNGLTETIIWDQIKGTVLEVDLSDVSYGLSDSVVIRATGTNMWEPSTSADFAVNSYPLSQGLIPGRQTSFLVNVTSLQGLTGPLGLSLKYPSEIAAVLNTTTVTLNSGTTSYASLTVTAPRNLGAAIYIVNVTAQSGFTTHYAAITVIIKPPDFFVLASSTIFPAGQPGSTPILVGSLSGFNGTVSLSLTTSPGTHLIASCNPVSITVNATDTLGASDCTFASLIPGIYSVNITGTSGSLTHTKTFQVIVTPPTTTPDFYMSVNPDFLSIAQGSTANATITLTALNGFKGNITLAGIGELGLSETFTPQTVNLTSASATSIMTVQIRPGLGTGIPYDIRIIGSNGTAFGGLLHATFLDVIVFAPPPPDFSVATNQPDVSLNSGQSGTFTLSTTGRNGFSAQVSLTTSVSPVQGLTVNCPGNVNVTGSLSTSCNLSATTPGLYLVTLTLTGSGHTHSTSITVRVGDFMMMFTAPHVVTPGSSMVSTITMMSVYGFTGTVSVSDTPLPADLTCDISPTSITVPSSSATVTLSCTPSSAGTFTVTITASGGSLTHTVTIVIIATDFSLTSSSSSFTANAGTGGTSTITIAPQSGFTGIIDMTVTAPSGVSCSFSRTTIRDSGATTLTCSSNTPGTYVVTVNGSSNGKSKSINETFTVNSQPQQTPTLLGLQPGLFFTILAGVIVFIAAVIGILVYRQNRRPAESKSSTTV